MFSRFLKQAPSSTLRNGFTQRLKRYELESNEQIANPEEKDPNSPLNLYLTKAWKKKPDPELQTEPLNTFDQLFKTFKTKKDISPATSTPKLGFQNFLEKNRKKKIYKEKNSYYFKKKEQACHIDSSNFSNTLNTLNTTSTNLTDKTETPTPKFLSQTTKNFSKKKNQKENFNFINLKKELLKKKNQNLQTNNLDQKKFSTNSNKKPQLTKEEAQLYLKLNFPLTLENFEFLRAAGAHLNLILKNLSSSGDAYEPIRLYNSAAQSCLFSYLPQLFSNKRAKRLFGKTLKLERWAVVLIFFYQISSGSGCKEMSKLRGIGEILQKNHFLQVSWLKLAFRRYKLEDIIDPEHEYIEIVENEQLLILLLKKNLSELKIKISVL